MRTTTMKTFRLWMVAVILTIISSTVLTSCTKDDPIVLPPEPQPLILKGEAAVEWTKEHLDSLVNVYMADCGNMLDPDMTRDLLKCIGYTRLNVLDYREAGWLIDSVVFIRLMDRATEANNKTILFTMGMYGCGKTGNPSLSADQSPDGKAKEWPLYDLENKQLMIFDEFNIHPEKESQRKILDWDRTYFLTKYYCL